jgi:phage protein U
MLSQVGAVQFEVAPFNMHETSHETGASFASHEVVGAMPPLEFMGEAAESWTIRGRLFPQRYSQLGVGSGLSEMAAMQAMRQSGSAQYYMRGDGVPIGWVVIESISETSTFLGTDGVGRVIEFEIKLKRSQGPSADGIFNALVGLFS